MSSSAAAADSNASPPERTNGVPDFSINGGYRTDVPLVFIPGMKGSHLAFDSVDKEDGPEPPKLDAIRQMLSLLPRRETKRRKRAWLTLSALINFPPRPDDDPDRSLALPLTYGGEDGTVQDRGQLVVDGIVEHIVELGGNKGAEQSATNGKRRGWDGGLEFFPFYGHVTKHLEEVNARYLSEISTQGSRSDYTGNGARDDSLHSRPTTVFSYDWRRPLQELSDDFHSFCETEFPNQPVQVCAHSLGGLMAFGAMRKYPEKYRPGAVFVGVPFGTGIQYLQDMHRGYFTELDRCRQFLPPAQFTFSSHWSFFPLNETELGDTFVDVTNAPNVSFVPDMSAIGKPGTTFQPEAVPGETIYLDFYDADEWEKHEIGIFDQLYTVDIDDERMLMYKDHMRIQMQAARVWRETVLCGGSVDDDIPPLVVCATDSVPTVNQILRRKRQQGETKYDKTKNGVANGSLEAINDDKSDGGAHKSKPVCSWEYDYISGRSVPGDGRIDYVKAFPPPLIPHEEVKLSSVHAKQMCWEESGGSWGKIWCKVVKQIQEFDGKPLQNTAPCRQTHVHDVEHE